MAIVVHSSLATDPATLHFTEMAPQYSSMKISDLARLRSATPSIILPSVPRGILASMLLRCLDLSI